MQDLKRTKTILLIILVIFLILLLLFFLFRGSSKKYIVVFDTDGGSTISSITVKKNERIPRPEDPVKEGFLFDEWYYHDQLFDFDTRVTSNMVLKAKWITEEMVGVHLDLHELSLKPGTTYTFQVENTTHQKLQWKSSDDHVVTVDENGKLTAVAIGHATITVMTEDGQYQDTCSVTVTNDFISITSVSILGASKVLVGKTIQLTASIQPANASHKAVIWKSSNEKIATVDNFGRVKGMKVGKVTITVTTEDGKKTATKVITVDASSSSSSSSAMKPESAPSPTETSEQKPSPTSDVVVPVSGVRISGESSVQVGEVLPFNAIIEPSNATNQNVKWKSSDEDIATIDENGNVIGVDEGQVTITVTTEDGEYSDSKTVTVTSTYEIVFTKKYNNYHVPVGYQLDVYKNKKAWDEFTAIIYRGSTKKFADFFAAMDEVDEEEKTASIKINNIVIDKVLVSYQ